MKTLRTGLALALLALPASGCFVFEELDSGANFMNKTPAKEAPTASRSRRPEPSGEKTEWPTLTEWWKKARTIASGPKNESIVRCRLGGSESFMDRGQCLTSGGEALD